MYWTLEVTFLGTNVGFTTAERCCLLVYSIDFHPLENMKFVVSGKFKKVKAEVSKAVMRMGGTVVTKCDGKVAAVISTKGKHAFANTSIPPCGKQIIGISVVVKI